MGIGDKRVIRWPFALTSADNDVVFSDDGGIPAYSTQTIPAATYRANGEGTAVDFVQALEDAANAAYLALYAVAGSITASLDTGGRITLANAGARDIKIAWTSPATTLEKKRVGELLTTTVRTIPTAGSHTFAYTAHGQWAPNRMHVDDAPERDSHVYRKNKGVNQVPDYVRHSDLDSPGRVRRIRWEDVIGARMLQSLADDAVAAPLAGLVAGDTGAAFELLVAYVLDDSQPLPTQVYIYTTNDPTTHEEQGPYYLDLPQEIEVFGGAGWDMERDDLRQRRFALELGFVLV